MIDIYTSLNLYYENIVECIYSDDNSDQCIMRIKMIENSDNIYEQEDHLTLLKAIEYNIIYNLLIKGIKGIKKVSLEGIENIEYKDKEFKKVHKWTLNTDGSNMKEILLNINVNSHKSKSNDIREIYELLGIEAARKALAIELENVIGEGKLNYRHLSLLVDTMTSRGQLMSIDRHGINRSDVGPLAKSSFEETTDMLVNASIFSEYDNLNGISANVMLGHKAPCGTGDFNVLINENKFINVMKNFNNVIIENNNTIDEDINQDDIFININLPEVKKNNSKCFNRFI